MNKKPLHLLLAWLLAMLLLPGCAGVPGLVTPPKISVQDVVLSDLSLNRSSALVRLSLNNPNPFPLPLRGVEYGLRLNGAMVASGRQAQMGTINPNQTAVIEIPVQIKLSQMFNLIPVILRDGGAQYQLQGAVSLPLVSVPFSRQGGIGVSP